MIKKLGRSLQVYYFVALTLILSATSYAVFYYWSSGLMNGQNIASLYEASVWIEDLQKNNYPDRIENLAKKDRVRNGVALLDKVSIKLDDINRVKADETYEDLLTQKNQLKRNFNKLLTYPEAKSIFKVFAQRMNKFDKFVSTNNWRTLTRMSARIISRINKYSVYSYPRIKGLNRSILQDLKIMKNVTMGSVLSASDKRLISVRLDTLRTEMLMLKKYIVQVDKFLATSKTFNKNYEIWLESIAPEITLAKISINKKNKEFAFILTGIGALTLILLFVGVVLYMRSAKANQRKIEDYIINYTKESVIPLDPKEDETLSENFRNEFYKVHSYIQKRMSFGQIFQAALPFGSIMLDTNLKVIWCNNNFCDIWELDKKQVEDDSLSWDYILRFTNLADNDPILDAIQNNLSGIFQIQVKVGANTPTLPFEMYVAPVEHAGLKRVMVFFYPLSSMEETISNQAKSILAPIEVSLKSMLAMNFNDRQESLQDDFHRAGMDHIFDHFQAVNEANMIQRESLLNQINDLDNKIEVKDEMIENVIKNSDTLLETDEVIRDQLKKVRNGLVSVVDMNAQTLKNGKDMHAQSQGVLAHSKNAFSFINDLIKKIETTNNCLGNLTAAKKEIKQHIDEMYEEKLRIQQVIDQAMVVQKSDKIDAQTLEQIFAKLKGEVKNMDSLVGQFQKTAKTLDVSASKVEITLDYKELEAPLENMKLVQEHLDNAELMLRSLDSEHRDLKQQGHHFEDRVVTDLKFLFDKYKEAIIGHEEIHSATLGHEMPSLPESSMDHNILTENVDVDLPEIGPEMRV